MEKISILVVDDEPSVLKAIQTVLQRENMQVTCVQDANEVLAALEGQSYDLILLDIMMPGRDGYSLLKEIRDHENYTPVVLLSGKDGDSAQIEGFGLGADDYITKPFSKALLVSRIKAIVRRNIQYAKPQEEVKAVAGDIKSGDFHIQMSTQTVHIRGEEVSLSSKEFSLLCLFIEREGQTVTKQEIFSTIWKSEKTDNNTILVYVKRLRDKIEVDPTNPKYLTTVWGKGYMFRSEN